MMFVKNVKPAVVVIGGKVIAPLEVVPVDADNQQIKRLIESGHLVEAAEVETPQTIMAAPNEAIEAMTVNELRAYLMDKGVKFDPKATKTELLELAKGA